ncbi:MAG TPA: HTH domain-containing protein [Bacillales bacterium]|nr:HTH domain-containing protein [Bacillales bacterium]
MEWQRLISAVSTSCVVFLLQSEDYVFAQDLMNELKVSRRTLYYDMKKVNDWLTSQALEPVQRSYAKGFYLSGETKQERFRQFRQCIKLEDSVCPPWQAEIFFYKIKQIFANEAVILCRFTV